MRIDQLLGRSELRRLEASLPGVDVGLVRVRTLPRAVETLVRNVDGVTIGRTVWLREERLVGEPDRLLRLVAHELAHVDQWRRLGPVGFLIRYVIDYLLLRARGRSHAAAYAAIPAEIEAREAAERVVSREL